MMWIKICGMGLSPLSRFPLPAPKQHRQPIRQALADLTNLRRLITDAHSSHPIQAPPIATGKDSIHLISSRSILCRTRLVHRFTFSLGIHYQLNTQPSHASQERLTRLSTSRRRTRRTRLYVFLQYTLTFLCSASVSLIELWLKMPSIRCVAFRFFCSVSWNSDDPPSLCARTQIRTEWSERAAAQR